jgi:hypothetical protein
LNGAQAVRLQVHARLTGKSPRKEIAIKKINMKVTMYAHWRSREDYQNMPNNPTASPFLENALKIAHFEMGTHEVADTFFPSTKTLNP